MGTTKSGRYLNTKGSARTVSDYALIHSSEGAFVKSIKEKGDRCFRQKETAVPLCSREK